MGQVLTRKGYEKQSLTSSIVCDICNEPIRYRASYCDSGIRYAIVCDICYKRFSEMDIQLMRNLFNAYGGYFGKYKKLKSSVYRRIKELRNINNFSDNFSNAEQINLQLLHAALLFGFTPKEYFKGICND